MATSQNGWSTIDSTQLDKSPIPGTSVVPVPGLRKGDVAIILLEVGRLFNKNVAKVYNPGCWGWNTPIPIPGSSVISNHGSGTAIDLNAPSFPWQTRTMTSKQRSACRAIVKHMGGVVAWGGDFTTIVDEMHFEIIGSAAQVKALANKIRAGGTLMPTEKEVVYYFKHAGEGSPSKKQIAYYTNKPWVQLHADLVNSLKKRLKVAANL